jgi:hypothetical protein
MAKNDEHRQKYRTVKITRETHVDLRELIDRAARNGWASLGADRLDKVTIANVMDEAMKLLKLRKPLPAKK